MSEAWTKWTWKGRDRHRAVLPARMLRLRPLKSLFRDEFEPRKFHELGSENWPEGRLRLDSADQGRHQHRETLVYNEVGDCRAVDASEWSQVSAYPPAWVAGIAVGAAPTESEGRKLSLMVRASNVDVLTA